MLYYLPGTESPSGSIKTNGTYILIYPEIIF